MEAVTPIRMLLAHPSAAVRSQARQALNTRSQIELVAEAADEAELWRATTTLHPDVIVTADRFQTGRIPHPAGPLIRRLLQQLPDIPLVVIASDVASSVRALAEGASAALTTNDLAKRLLPTLDPLLRLNRRRLDKPVNGQPVGPAGPGAPAADHQIEDALAPLSLAGSNRRAIYVLGMETFFNARHFVVIDGRAGPVHAHSFRVTVKIRQSFQPDQAYGLGFGEVRQLVQSQTNQFNDQLLNYVPPFNSGADIQPTTEHLAAVLYQSIQQKLPVGMALDSVTVWESPTNYVTYQEEAG